VDKKSMQFPKRKFIGITCKVGHTSIRRLGGEMALVALWLGHMWVGVFSGP
jgi:hypothetical protein